MLCSKATQVKCTIGQTPETCTTAALTMGSGVSASKTNQLQLSVWQSTLLHNNMCASKTINHQNHAQQQHLFWVWRQGFKHKPAAAVSVAGNTAPQQYLCSTSHQPQKKPYTTAGFSLGLASELQTQTNCSSP
jgi:hypothetical protein